MKIHTLLAETIRRALPELEGQPLDFQPSPENQSGDLGLGCFRYARALGKKPPEVAALIAGIEYPKVVSHVEATGPYVNFSLDNNTFAAALLRRVLNEGEAFGSDSRGSGRHVLLEHTSINPNASPHIGRARNGLIGDTLTRLLRFEGFDVNVHYYVNDMGKQIGLLLLQTEGEGELDFDSVLEKYVAANTRAKEDPAFEARGIELLMKMEQGDPEVRAGFTRLVDICLNGQLATLKRMGFTYDTFDRESTFIDDPRMAKVLDTLREKGSLFTDDDQRTVADLEPLGWKREEGRYVVLQRGNGSSMYMLRDIVYSLEKADRARDHNIIVLGEDHQMYAEQLALIMRALDVTPPEAVHYSYILLREGKMSTRQGTVVLLSDFLDEAERRAREKVDAQWPDLPDTERAAAARMIGIGAVKFAILSVRPNRNVIFDWEQALTFQGDSGPYIQYSCTRIASILRKYGDLGDLPGVPVTITHSAEWRLVLRLAEVERDIAAALDGRNTAVLATTALDIARRFSGFYTECPVLSADNENVRKTRVIICLAVKQTLETLLGLMGIEAPERM